MANNNIFDAGIADSQGTSVVPLSPDSFDIEKYADYEAALLEKNRQFWKADSGVLVYRRFRVPEVFSYSCKDRELSLSLQLAALEKSMEYKADIANFLEPWYGIGTVAAAFGAEYEWPKGQAPGIKAPFKTIAEALEYDVVPIEHTDIGKQTLGMIEYFLEKTKGKIPLSLTDIQSPMNVASEIIDINNFFMSFIDNPEGLKKLLALISDLLIDFTKKQVHLIGDALVWPGHGFAGSKAFSGLGMSDDTIVMLSNDYYKEFAAPNMSKIGNHFGGAVFHSCGNWSDRVRFVKQIIGLKMVEEGELYGFIDSLTPISYQIQKHFPRQLKIAGQLNEKLEMGIATHKNEPLLLAILEKSINSIKDETKQNILQRWGSYKFQQSNSAAKTAWKILSPILLLGILLLISHYVLRQYNKKLKKQVQQNIEELREKDEILLQKQRMAAMGEMLSMIAHQWRQPLGAINFALMGIEVKLASGYFNLETKDGREKFLTYLEKKHQSINEYVQHLSTTTDDFRNFFNPNKSKEAVPLTSPIENALSIVQIHMEKRDIKIIKEYQTDATLPLYSNEVMQVILTLLKNAEDNFLIKKIPDPKITIKTQKINNNLMISIEDNGGGIPKDIVAKIFEPYYSTKDDKNGTGLGLYMSRIIIENHHNGNLRMKNSDGGVCFEMTFKTYFAGVN